MTGADMPRRWTCVSVDIQGYGRWNAAQQQAAQRELLALLDASAGAAGMDRGRWVRQEQGDGELALVPESEPVVRLVDEFVDVLTAQLYRRNGELAPDARLRLRLAMDHGPVATDGANGWVGAAVVAVSRLVGARPLRDALTVAPEANLAVLLSARLFDDVVRPGYARVPPETFRQVPVAEKEYREAGWLRVPRTDVHRLPLPEPAPESVPGHPDGTAPGGGNSAVFHVNGGTFTESVIGFKL